MGEAMTRGDTVYALAEHERIGFVFPIYGWNMPRVVRQFISRLQLSNYKNNYTYFACTCGDDMGTTEAQVARLLASKGWKLDQMSLVILSILRLAIWEIYYEEQVPDRVAISEALALTERYSGEEDKPFVNGILGTIQREKEARA